MEKSRNIKLLILFISLIPHIVGRYGHLIHFIYLITPTLASEYLPEDRTPSSVVDDETWEPRDCEVTWDNIMEHMDWFVVGHSLVWMIVTIWLKFPVFVLLCTLMDEFMEATFYLMIPTLAECWFDTWIMDIVLCNMSGILLGTYMLWRSGWEVRGIPGRYGFLFIALAFRGIKFLIDFIFIYLMYYGKVEPIIVIMWVVQFYGVGQFFKATVSGDIFMRNGQAIIQFGAIAFDLSYLSSTGILGNLRWSFPEHAWMLWLLFFLLVVVVKALTDYIWPNNREQYKDIKKKKKKGNMKEMNGNNLKKKI